MPELPDVEKLKLCFDGNARGREVVHVDVRAPRMLRDVSPQRFAERVSGRRFGKSLRHGKWLLVELESDSWVAFHFGMTGRLDAVTDGALPKYTRVLFDFADGTRLAYVNQRMIGALRLAGTPEGFARARGLGPDALDPSLDEATLATRLGAHGGQVKAVLMDQGVVAGIGNLTADEILFHARLHPRTPMTSLSDIDRRNLAHTVRLVLSTLVATGSGSGSAGPGLPGDYLLRARHDGAPCPHCSGTVQHIRAAGRTSYFCPACQREPPAA